MLKTIIISRISINELDIFEELVARWIFMVSKFITDTLLLEYKITSYTLKIDLSNIACRQKSGFLLAGLRLRIISRAISSKTLDFFLSCMEIGF